MYEHTFTDHNSSYGELRYKILSKLMSLAFLHMAFRPSSKGKHFTNLFLQELLATKLTYPLKLQFKTHCSTDITNHEKPIKILIIIQKLTAKNKKIKIKKKPKKYRKNP